MHPGVALCALPLCLGIRYFTQHDWAVVHQGGSGLLQTIFRHVVFWTGKTGAIRSIHARIEKTTASENPQAMLFLSKKAVEQTGSRFDHTGIRGSDLTFIQHQWEHLWMARIENRDLFSPGSLTGLSTTLEAPPLW